MDSFASNIVLAGVLVFVGGLLALGAQRAGQMGAPRWLKLTGAWSAAFAMIAAIALVVVGVSALPGEGDVQNTDQYVQ
jgi:hypothetical protein